MKNTYPNKLEFINVMASYVCIFAGHSAPVDYDILGKSLWAANAAQPQFVRREIVTDYANIHKNYFLVTNLAGHGTVYNVQAAFYDAMIDSQLLEAKIGYQLSETIQVTTKVPPTISDITVTATPVEIGVSLPMLTLTTTGDGETFQVQYRKVGAAEWSGLYEGAGGLKPQVSVMPGTYEFRIRGIYNLPDGVTQDISAWYQYPQALTVDYMQIPPAAATGLTYKVAKINDSFTRYDVKISWNWVRGTGAPIREFIVYYTTAAEYAISGWTKAQIINTGASQYTILSSFPYNIPYKLKVVSRAWGLEDFAYATSSILDFSITSSTVFDNSFTRLTGIDVNYSGIFGYLDPLGARTQTFRLDAATGAVVIGTPDAVTGIAPFSFDPINKKLNVDGSVITNSIYSANFILSNLTGTSPVLRSQEKLYYGHATQGIWTGYDGDTFKFDIGNSSQYMRWDGTTLRISGNVVVGTPNGDLSLSAGVTSTNTVFVYKSSTTVPATPTSTAYPPTGWVTTPPSVVVGYDIYVCQGKIDPLTNALKAGQVWSPPIQFSGQDGAAGVSSFKSFVFYRSNSAPTTPTGGSFSSPIPTTTGWTDGIPSGESQLWSSTRIFTSTGVSPQQAAWTTPVAMTNTASLEIMYSTVATSPGTPETVPANWTSTASTSSIWMATRTKINGTFSAWSVYKVKGETGATGATGATGPAGAAGANGQRGPGIYRLGIAGFTGTFSTTSADTFFNTTLGTGKVKYDVLTQYSSTNVATATTMMWDGSTWTTPALVVHGDMIATGTVRASSLVGETGFFQNAGIDIIYNHAAAISSSPETTYTMKIDLANGFIHIR